MFLDHINNINPAIRFTVEGNQGNGSIPFLDTFVKPEADNSLSTTAYCKPTHTDQYLQWENHYNLSAKYSVIGTLTHRAKTVCTGPELFQREIQHLREALVKYKYPRWAIHKVQSKYINSNAEDTRNNNSNQEGSPAQGTHNPSRNTEGMSPKEKPSVGHITIPYTQGLGDSFKKICRKYGIHTHFKGNMTLRQLLVKPKDQDPKEKKSSVIYRYQYGELACDEYIGETSRTLGERYREHLKESSPVHVYTIQSGHKSTPDSFNILGREDQGLTRTIMEAIYIRVNNPTLNRNIGKFNLNHIWDNLNHIWDRVLLNTSGIK